MPSRYNEQIDKNSHDKLIAKKNMYEKKIENISNKASKLLIKNQSLRKKEKKILAERKKLISAKKTPETQFLKKKKEEEQLKVHNDKINLGIKLKEYEEKTETYNKIIENITNNLSKFDANKKRSMSLLPTNRRISSQMSRIPNMGKKNYIKDNNASKSSNISKDNSIDDIEIDINKEEEAQLLAELDKMEQDIEISNRGGNIKKIKKNKKNKK
jgi:hypothetical protein